MLFGAAKKPESATEERCGDFRACGLAGSLREGGPAVVAMTSAGEGSGYAYPAEALNG